jgi:hypothetical protein
LAVRDLFVSLRITVRNRVGSWESRSGWSLLLVVSTYDDGEFVDGDVGARVRNGRKSGRVAVRLKTDGGVVVKGDTGRRGDVWGWSWGGGRGGAIIERTRSQTKVVGLGLGSGCGEIQRGGDGDGNVFCADCMTAV